MYRRLSELDFLGSPNQLHSTSWGGPAAWGVVTEETTRWLNGANWTSAHDAGSAGSKQAQADGFVFSTWPILSVFNRPRSCGPPPRAPPQPAVGPQSLALQQQLPKELAELWAALRLAGSPDASSHCCLLEQLSVQRQG